MPLQNLQTNCFRIKNVTFFLGRDGWGLSFGGGYDFSLNKNLAITPFINYSFGEMDN